MKRKTYVSLCCGLLLSVPGLSLVAAQAAAPNAQGPSDTSLARSELASFSSWAARYRQVADLVEKGRLVAEGIKLADRRAAAMSSLIHSDPEQALANSISTQMLRALPREV